MRGASEIEGLPSGMVVLIGRDCRDASQIVRTITSAVKYLHDQGIVHRGTFTHAETLRDETF